MADSKTIETVREIALRRASIPHGTPPSRLLWFVVGALFAVFACVFLNSIGLRTPAFGFGIVAKPGIEKVTVGMEYKKVLAILGPAAGTLRAAELSSFDDNLASYFPAGMTYRAIEEKGGRFVFWLSRSNGDLVFNVVALDENDVVVDLKVCEETFFGQD